MAENNGVPYGRKTQREPAVKEVNAAQSKVCQASVLRQHP